MKFDILNSIKFQPLWLNHCNVPGNFVSPHLWFRCHWHLALHIPTAKPHLLTLRAAKTWTQEYNNSRSMYRYFPCWYRRYYIDDTSFSIRYIFTIKKLLSVSILFYPSKKHRVIRFCHVTAASNQERPMRQSMEWTSGLVDPLAWAGAAGMWRTKGENKNSIFSSYSHIIIQVS